MKLRLFPILLALLLTKSLAISQHYDHYIHDQDASTRDHQLDVTYMKVQVDFVPKEGKVNGKVTHTFTPLRKQVDTVFWDAPKINILKVSLKSGSETIPVSFTSNDEGVITRFSNALSWDKSYEISFEYAATPERGIYFIGWNLNSIPDPRNQSRQQIWTQGQGIDNRHWIPMYDNMNDKFITETIVTFQNGFSVLSNGDLVEKKANDNNTTTWHYKMRHPHAGYLLMVAIDRYAVKRTETNRKTPVEFWYYPEHEEKVELTSLHTEKMIEFLEDETGFPYPWGKYSQVMVQDFIYGAMENTSATIFGDFFNVDEYSFNDRNYVNVNAHELTHQWFGDLITARSNTGTWLQESFATYYAKLFMKEVYGEDEYRWSMRGEVNRALSASKSDLNPIVHTKAGTSRVYPKGSSVLHMLRYVLGDEEFKRVIKYYLEKHAYQNVETADLRKAIEDVLGKPMDWFFDQWLYRGGEPHYKVETHQIANELTLQVDQIQDMTLTVGTFKMPINCGVYFTDGSKIEKTYWVEDKTELIRFKIPEGKKVAFTLFDINSEIIKQLTFEKSTEMSLAQFEKAPNMIDRYDALLALDKVEISKKRDLLLNRLEEETHYSIKAEITRQLLGDDDAVKKLNKCLKEEDVRVRRSVLTNSNDVKKYHDVFVDALEDKSYINIELALQKLVEAEPERAAIYLAKTDGVIGQNHNVRITWLGYKLIQLRKDSSGMLRDKSSRYFTLMNEITLYTSDLYEFRTRINAMKAIQKFNFLSAPAIENMLDACISKNGRLASPAKDVLLWYKDQYELRQAIQKVFESLPYSEEEKDKLREMSVVD